MSGYSRGSARAEFFRAIQRHAPHVVAALKEQSPEEWARKWFGGAEWAVRQASQTKEAWEISPASEQRAEFAVYRIGLFPSLGVPSHSSFDYRPWSPAKEREETFRTRLEVAFKDHLEREIEEQKNRAPVPSVAAHRSLERDCEWLVLYQFQKLAFRELAERLEEGSPTEKVSTDAIRKAVTSLAKHIELNLRKPDRPGRPRTPR